jgi:hypothetical protein
MTRLRLVAAAITPAQQDPTGPSRPAEVISGVIADALSWVLGHHPGAELAALIGGDA